MKLFYYRGAEPNFGDELNEWLIPLIFPNQIDDDSSKLLLAIGSIIYDSHPANAKKIVFGSGYGGYTPIPRLDETWDIKCVRGPITAKTLEIPVSKVAGDAAILMKDYYKPSGIKRFDVSFIPHFESIRRGHWKLVCKLSGVHFIDPRLPVQTVLDEISESRLVICEAMHGAITSDALRVPWVAMRPLDKRHHFKWSDWAGALDMMVRFHDVPPSSVIELVLKSRGRVPNGPIRRLDGGGLLKPVDAVLSLRAARALKRLAKVEPQLSSDAAMENVLDRLRTAAEEVRRDYA